MGPVRAWFVVGSLQILVVRAMISTSAFGLFDSKASVFSTLCFDGEELHACVPWRVPPADILSVGTKSHVWQGCLQIFLFFTVYSVQFSNSSKERMTEGRRPTNFFYVLLFFRGRFMSYYPSSVIVFVFIDIYLI